MISSESSPFVCQRGWPLSGIFAPGKIDGAYIEWDVAAAYKQNYPELTIVCEVPYDVEGSSIGVIKGNEALLAGVNEAIAACIEDGSFSQFVADALEQASGEIYEGLLEG